MSTISLRYERMGLAALHPRPDNTKVHTQTQIDHLKQSIERFGFNDPIGVLPDGTVVEGEGRLRAAQELGLAEVPVIVLEGMSERDADLYRIAHNKIALIAGFDLSRLMATLRELVGEGITLQAMGFADENALASMTPAQPLATVTAETEADNLDFIVIWDTQEQKAEFDAFVQAIRNPGEPASEALFRTISNLHPVAEEGTHVVARV